MSLSSALGLVLAEDVSADLDMPPFDKSMMDGYAVRTADLPAGRGTLSVVEEITAGRTPAKPISNGEAARIMTGAPIPQGADAVIQVERTSLVAGVTEAGQKQIAERVQIDDLKLRIGQNILEHGGEMRAGDVVLSAGALVRPQEIGVLATVGRATLQVVPRPSVAILPTGDEIVEPNLQPKPSQIRNTNGPTLIALTERAGGVPRYLGIALDRLDSLRTLVEVGLKSNVLLLCGGVSAGKLDLVPEVLQELGVEAHFHKVEMKPGKPLLFGTRGKTLIFGLPGNPVSSFVCFELFVRPALRVLRGLRDPGITPRQATLAEDFPYRTDRPTYHPAWLDTRTDSLQVKVVPWIGSPDLRALVKCNCFVLLPAGDHKHCAGAVLQVLRCDQVQ